MLRKVILLNCLMICGVFPCPADEVLDLTNAEISGGPEGAWWTMLQKNSTEFWPLKPSLSILSFKLDREDYRLGQEFIYEVTIKNISDGDLTIPVQPDGFKVIDNIDECPPGFIYVILAVRVDNEWKTDPNRWTTIHTIPLFGSDLVPLSLKRLKQNESITIRGRGAWKDAHIMNPRYPDDVKYGPMRVFATWTFCGWMVDGLERSFDSKSVEVQLNAPAEASDSTKEKIAYPK